MAPEEVAGEPGTYADFLSFVAEKVEMSLNATDVKNRGGFVVDAIRENYQDPAGAKGAGGDVQPKKLEKRSLRTWRQNLKLSEIISFGKPSMPTRNSLNVPQKESNLTSSANASSDTHRR